MTSLEIFWYLSLYVILILVFGTSYSAIINLPNSCLMTYYSVSFLESLSQEFILKLIFVSFLVLSAEYLNLKMSSSYYGLETSLFRLFILSLSGYISKGLIWSLTSE